MNIDSKDHKQRSEEIIDAGISFLKSFGITSLQYDEQKMDMEIIQVRFPYKIVHTVCFEWCKFYLWFWFYCFF